MARSFIRGPVDGAGKRLETSELNDGTQLVHREGTFLGDADDYDADLKITNAAPGTSEYGAVVRLPDGGDVTQGAKADAAALSGDGSVVALLKALRTWLTPAGTGTVSETAASGTVVTLVAANTSRKGAVLHNDGTVDDLYVKLGAAASTSSYSNKLTPGATWVIPPYTGIITGVWGPGVTGTCRATELT